jgi:photosystem II stability/assembly factor-like uncharacterized protein
MSAGGMSVVAPPEPPRPDELEALIREARARQRRRALMICVSVLVAVGIGFALWMVLSGSDGSAVGSSDGRITGTAQSGGGAGRRRGIGGVGSAGGVTWAISGRGFWLTTDGGRAWRHARLPHLARGGVADGRADPIANIADVQFVDRRDGWVSTTGRSGIYRTTDGGRTWSVLRVPGCRDSCANARISFLDARHGFALTALRRGEQLFRTADGGETWQLVSRPAVGGPISFLNGRDGFLVEPQLVMGLVPAEPGVLFHTSAGGRTWAREAVPPYDMQLPFAAFGRNLVVSAFRKDQVTGVPETIYASADAGDHWKAHSVPLPVTAGLTSFSAASPDTWYLSATRKLLVTRDGGRSWRTIVIHGLPPRAKIEKIVFSSRRDGWAIVYGLGPDGMLFHTTDGGIRWRPDGPVFASEGSQR